MKKTRFISYLILLSAAVNICKMVYADKINDQTEIVFANTVSVEHNSGILMNKVRNEHPTVGNDPAFCFIEKFQVYLVFKDDLEFSCLNSCLNIPPGMYMSINVFYTHNENYALCAAVEGEIGFGNYKNPFMTAGMGLIYEHDMVFNVKKYDEYGALAEVNWFLSMGYRDDLHLYFNFTPGALGGEGINRPFFNIDAAIGYRKLSHFFIRFCGNFTENHTGYPDEGEYDYLYTYSFLFLHLQYYGDSFGISAGFTGLDQEYKKDIYNSSTDMVDSKTLDSSSAKGFGFTFYKNNIGFCADVFGELHVLRDDESRWVTVSKLGARVYF